jgi:hypothetical protein
MIAMAARAAKLLPLHSSSWGWYRATELLPMANFLGQPLSGVLVWAPAKMAATSAINNAQLILIICSLRFLQVFSTWRENR